MSRKATGQVMVREGKRGWTYAIRFRVGGRRRYKTLGSAEEGWTRARAEEELTNVLADVRRGIWHEPEPEPVVEEARPEPTFHEFASEWLEAKRVEGLAERTIEDYRGALVLHLLPFFAGHRLSEITAREVDRYKTAKAAEGVLGANQVNKTLTRLSQILAVAVEYELIAANPAAGRRRRLKPTRPSRPLVEPEQLMALLEAAGRGRTLLAVLAGAGLRIGEALALRWADVDLAVGTLRVVRSKTDAGARVVDLTPALREELATYKADARWSRPGDFVFATKSGRALTRTNARRSLLLPAIDGANERLERLGIAPIGALGFHGLRRTYASLRAALGDDPTYIAEQIGHEDVTFSLNVYAKAVKRRARLSGTHLEAFDRALDWAQAGTNELFDPVPVSSLVNAETRNPAL
jgi:integrase